MNNSKSKPNSMQTMSAFNVNNEFNDNSIETNTGFESNKRMANQSANECTDSSQQLSSTLATHLSQQSVIKPSLMPVSELQELCAKNGLKNPEYRLCRTEGNSHSPLFTIQVLLNDQVIGEGMAKSKKSAKHSAAQKALQEIKCRQLLLSRTEMTSDFTKLGINETDNCDTSAAQVDRNELESKTIKMEPKTSCSSQANGVSILQEICAKNGLEMPKYSELDRLGSCHEPVFWITCQVAVGTEQIIGKASGKSKQLAKRCAAEEVLKILEQKGIDLFSTNNLYKKKSKHYSHPNDSTVDQQGDVRGSLEFMEALNERQDLENLFETNDSDYCLRLNMIAEKLNCLTDYMTLQEEQTKTNRFKCLLQLKRNVPLARRLPVFVSWGTSAVSVEQAMQKAAQKAIIMVKVLKM